MASITARIGRWIGRAALALVLVAGPAAGQLTESDLEDTGPASEPYARAIWGEGIDDEVRYIRPSAPFSADTRIAIAVPETREQRQTNLEVQRWVWGLVFAGIIVFVLSVFWMNAGGIGARFTTPDEGRRHEDARRGPRPMGIETDDSPADQFLARLAAMSDRREALIQLVSRALVEAADTNNVRLGRAQTARGAVRALPAGWRYLATLRDLVRQAELVHFGGRDISEERWRECFEAARPIVRGAA